MKGASCFTKSLLLRGGISSFLFLLCPTVTLAQPPLPQDPTKGARLFVGKGCVKCHALKGEGGKVGPDLGKIDLGNTQLDLAGKLWNHIPSMTRGMKRAKIIKPNLTGEEITEISGYLYFLKFFDGFL